MSHPQDEQEREGPVDHITEEVGGAKGWGCEGPGKGPGEQPKPRAKLRPPGGGWKEKRTGLLSSNNSLLTQ